MGGAAYTQGPWGVHSTGVDCMQEQTENLLRRLEGLELAHRDSTKRMEGLPRVDDFLVNLAGTNEIQPGTLTKGLVEVAEVIKGLLARQGQTNTTPTDPEVFLVLRREVESLLRATENLPQAYLKLKNEVQAWGERVESTVVQLRANDA